MQLTKEDIALKYHDAASLYRNNGWVQSYVMGLHWKRKKLFSTLKGKTLDVACGTGENFAYFPPTGDYTAIDYTPAMLTLARERAQKLGLKIDVRRMDAEHLEFEDGTFDNVVSTMSTCTFPNPIAAIQEMARVCKGQILLVEHGRSSVGMLARYQDRAAHYHYAQLGCRWNHEPLELVKEAGLNIIAAERSLFGIVHTIVAAPKTAII